MIDLLPAELVNRPVNPPTGFFALNVEWHSPNEPSLRIWSRLIAVYGATDYAEYQVLDVLVAPKGPVLAMAGAGSTIVIHEIGIDRPTHTVALKGWSMLGASIPAAPGRLTAKLSRDDKQKQINIEVTDSLQGITQHTLFEQRDESWQFILVKQWQEKVPTTNP